LRSCWSLNEINHLISLYMGTRWEAKFIWSFKEWSNLDTLVHPHNPVT